MPRVASAVLLWAAICRTERSEWIHYGTVAGTRREAKRRYLATWNPQYAKDALKRVRFARVVVRLYADPIEQALMEGRRP